MDWLERANNNNRLVCRCGDAPLQIENYASWRGFSLDETLGRLAVGSHNMDRVADDILQALDDYRSNQLFEPKKYLPKKDFLLHKQQVDVKYGRMLQVMSVLSPSLEARIIADAKRTDYFYVTGGWKNCSRRAYARRTYMRVDLHSVYNLRKFIHAAPLRCISVYTMDMAKYDMSHWLHMAITNIRRSDGGGYVNYTVKSIARKSFFKFMTHRTVAKMFCYLTGCTYDVSSPVNDADSYVGLCQTLQGILADVLRNIAIYSDTKIVSGYAIPGIYADESRKHTCMSSNPGDCLDLYVNNPDIVKLAYITDGIGKVAARCLLWHIEGEKYRDKIWAGDSCTAEARQLNIQLEEKGYIYVGDVDEAVAVTLKGDWRNLPYMDNIYSVVDMTSDTVTLSTQRQYYDGLYYTARSTNGGCLVQCPACGDTVEYSSFDVDAEVCESCNEHISVYPSGDTIHPDSEYIVYSEYYDEYIYVDDATCCLSGGLNSCRQRTLDVVLMDDTVCGRDVFYDERLLVGDVVEDWTGEYILGCHAVRIVIVTYDSQYGVVRDDTYRHYEDEMDDYYYDEYTDEYWSKAYTEHLKEQEAKVAEVEVAV